MELDIADPHFIANAQELYADLRAQGPVSRVRFASIEQEVSDDSTEEQRGFLEHQEPLFVTHYDEVSETLLDDRFAVDPRSTMASEQVEKLESSFGHGGTSSLPPLEHYRRPRSINYRYGAPQRKCLAGSTVILRPFLESTGTFALRRRFAGNRANERRQGERGEAQLSAHHLVR